MAGIQKLSFLLLALLSAAACSRRDPAAELRAAMAGERAKLRACLPEHAPAEGGPGLAIAAVTREPSETRVRLVAYAVGEAADFDLPVYLMSRGRWLINDVGRAYLLDGQCREYKLKDRRPAERQKEAKNGRVRLERGEAFEVWLSFPRLPDEAHEGALVYGRRVLPFWLLSEPR